MPPRYSTLTLLALAALVALAVPQGGLSDLPSCASGALLQGITSSGCVLSDTKCICRSTALATSLSSIVQASCTPAEQQQVLAFAKGFCGEDAAAISAVQSHDAAAATRSSTTQTTSQSSQSSIGSSTASLTEGVVSTTSETTLPGSTVITGVSTAVTVVPSDSLITDTVPLASATGVGNGTSNATTATASPSLAVETGAAESNFGRSMGALAIAMMAMGFIFAEL